MGEKELTAKTFDYSVIEDKDDKGKLINLEGSISRRLARTAKEMLETGEEIKQAHDILAKYKDGVFCQWVERACDISLRTAQNYMNAFEKFGIDATVAKIEVSAMYALASPSTPKAAFNEAKKLADKGVAITQKTAKAIIKKHTPPKAESNGHKEPKPECQVSKGSHAWVSDGNGARYCEHCKEDHPDNVKRRRAKAGDEFKKVDDLYGQLFRAIDNVASGRSSKKGRFHKSCQDAMDGLFKAIEAWKAAPVEAT